MITKIGENAGLIWNALQKGAQGTKALKKSTLPKLKQTLLLHWLNLW